MRKSINIILLAVTTVICLFFAEIAVRIVAPATIYTDERNLTYNHDADLGWFPQKNSIKKFEGSREIEASHNSVGFRDIEYKANGKPNIAFLGDSYTWGYDVEANERFTEKLRAKFKNKYNILNMGVSGYGTDQEFLLLKKYYDQFQPKIVFLIFCDNDFDNNSKNIVYHGYHKPYFTFEDNQLKLNGVPVPVSTNYTMLNFDKNHPILSKSHIVKWSARLWGRLQYNFSKKKLPDPTYHIFYAMDQFLKERGSKLVIGTINHYPEMEKILADKNISYINLNNDFRYSSHGSHWTPEGHDFVAKKITKMLESDKSLKTNPSKK